MKKCLECGELVKDNDNYCFRCGVRLETSSKDKASKKDEFVIMRADRKSKGIVSFSLGCLSILCFALSWVVVPIPLSVNALVAGIVGLSFGAKCLNKYFGNALGITGFCLSITSTIGGTIVLLIANNIKNLIIIL